MKYGRQCRGVARTHFGEDLSSVLGTRLFTRPKSDSSNHRRNHEEEEQEKEARWPGVALVSRCNEPSSRSEQDRSLSHPPEKWPHTQRYKCNSIFFPFFRRESLVSRYRRSICSDSPVGFLYSSGRPLLRRGAPTAQGKIQVKEMQMESLVTDGQQEECAPSRHNSQ